MIGVIVAREGLPQSMKSAYQLWTDTMLTTDNSLGKKIHRQVCNGTGQRIAVESKGAVQNPAELVCLALVGTENHGPRRFPARAGQRFQREVAERQSPLVVAAK